jgi:hypothetical protein
MTRYPLAHAPLAMAVLMLLAGCQTPSSRATYAEIRKEMAVAARAPTTAAPLDAAVADALVPPVSALAGFQRRPSSFSSRSWPARATTCWCTPT